MKVALYSFQSDTFIACEKNDAFTEEQAQLILGFGAKQILAEPDFYSRLKLKFPNAQIALCSTAGEIFKTEVLDNTVSVTAILFEKTTFQTASVNIIDFENSFDAGAALVNKMDQNNLKYLMILSDGGKVNGSELVRGMENVIIHKIPVTGGLAGDGYKFVSTLAGLNEPPVAGKIIAIGLYGNAIQIGHGSMGGWETFDPERIVTKSTSNQLFEIDGKNALDLYKTYLGKYAEELPGSALLFPISVKLSDNADPVVRTILSIDDATNSMIFAGDVPYGARIRFMKANFDRLIDAATGAAQNTARFDNNAKPKLALLISCVGRKIILDKRVDEEVEAVSEALGDQTMITGFYSYGEISPLNPGSKCELHNQTMTITTFNE